MLKNQIEEAHPWSDQMLPLFPKRDRRSDIGIKRRLFLVPSTFGEEFEPGFAPLATPQSELPDISHWVRQFVMRLIEILSSRRSPHQLARWCHRKTFQRLLSQTTSFNSTPKIRKIYIKQPLESLAEITVTITDKDRVRALVLRFEGVDQRWLCTVINLM